jgi:hypothetical protein
MLITPVRYRFEFALIDSGRPLCANMGETRAAVEISVEGGE